MYFPLAVHAQRKTATGWVRPLVPITMGTRFLASNGTTYEVTGPVEPCGFRSFCIHDLNTLDGAGVGWLARDDHGHIYALPFANPTTEITIYTNQWGFPVAPIACSLD